MQLHGPRTKKFLNFHAWQNLLKEQVCSESSVFIGGNSPGVIAKTDHKSNSFMLEQCMGELILLVLLQVWSFKTLLKFQYKIKLNNLAERILQKLRVWIKIYTTC